MSHSLHPSSRSGKRERLTTDVKCRGGRAKGPDTVVARLWGGGGGISLEARMSSTCTDQPIKAQSQAKRREEAAALGLGLGMGCHTRASPRPHRQSPFVGGWGGVPVGTTLLMVMELGEQE